MITYREGLLGLHICDMFRISGSVVPKALFWSLPSAALAGCLWYYFRGDDESSSKPVSRVFNGYSFILGFMIVFRMQLAYQRFWEAATLTNELRSEWLDCVQTTFAFCSGAPEKKAEVEKFQHLLVRLVSMLHRSAIERLNMNEDEALPVIDNSSIYSLEFLGEHCDRCEIIYSWILRLLVQKLKEGVLAIPPPVLGRSFQELGAGLAKLHNVMKITTIPIPFPYVQMGSFLLLFHWALTPIMASLIMKNARWSAALAFMSVFCLWAIYYIAAEIEQPFGKHQNSLPCCDMQEELNRMMIIMLAEESQEPPEFDMSSVKMDRVSVVKQKTGRKTERQLMASRTKELQGEDVPFSVIDSSGPSSGPTKAWGAKDID
mmetsp:Transcript_86068/g.164669  ORF Transcript_86068/g.164669 Transcript_86068/m.164669 type:complete len:375 (+) Transcript_86068:93-1217(+)